MATIEEYVFCDDPVSGEDWYLAREFIWGERFPEPLVLIDWTGDGDVAAASAEVLHYVHDALGSVIGLTDAGDPDATPDPIAAKLVERYDYDPYGHTYVETWDASAGGGSGAFVRQSEPVSAYGNPFMWTAQRYDAGVGLYSFPARSYSPRLGRWLQRDPLGFVDGVNMYEYCRSMPTTFTDPLGMSIDDGTGGGGIGESNGEDPEPYVDPDAEEWDGDEDGVEFDPSKGLVTPAPPPLDEEEVNPELEQVERQKLWERMLEMWRQDSLSWPPFLHWQWMRTLEKMNNATMEEAQDAISRFIKYRLLWKQGALGVHLPEDEYTSWWAANLWRDWVWNNMFSQHYLYSMSDAEMYAWSVGGSVLIGGGGYALVVNGNIILVGIGSAKNGSTVAYWSARTGGWLFGTAARAGGRIVIHHARWHPWLVFPAPVLFPGSVPLRGGPAAGNCVGTALVSWWKGMGG